MAHSTGHKASVRELGTNVPLTSVDPVNNTDLDENEFRKLMELKTKPRSKRIAAIDGQIRRRVAELYSEK